MVKSKTSGPVELERELEPPKTDLTQHQGTRLNLAGTASISESRCALDVAPHSKSVWLGGLVLSSGSTGASHVDGSNGFMEPGSELGTEPQARSQGHEKWAQSPGKRVGETESVSAPHPCKGWFLHP